MDQMSDFSRKMLWGTGLIAVYQVSRLVGQLIVINFF